MKKSVAWLVALLVVQGTAVTFAQEKKLLFSVSGGSSLQLGNQQFKELFNFGPNGSVNLDYRLSPQLQVGAELGYSNFGLDRSGFLKIVNLPDVEAIEVKGGDMGIAEIMGIGKYSLRPGNEHRGWYVLAGGGLAAGSVSKIEVTSPLGSGEATIDGGTDLIFVTGAGLKYNISPKWKAFLEVRYAHIFSDKSISYLPVRFGTTF
jgi:opacity protein-like surface antigen